jgi:hypothetical protein
VYLIKTVAREATTFCHHLTLDRLVTESHRATNQVVVELVDVDLRNHHENDVLIVISKSKRRVAIAKGIRVQVFCLYPEAFLCKQEGSVGGTDEDGRKTGG